MALCGRAVFWCQRCEQFTIQHSLSITFLATVYISLPGILHNLCSSKQYIFGLTLLCCAHLNWKVVLLGTFCHQTLSSKPGILWIYSAFKTTGNSGKKGWSWWCQWSSGCRSRKRPEFQIYNSEMDESSKPIFPFFPEFPVVLNSLKSDFAGPS